MGRKAFFERVRGGVVKSDFDLAVGVMWHYTMLNAKSVIKTGKDLYSPQWEDAYKAVDQLQHFAKQGVKVRLK